MAEAVRLVVWDLDETFWRGTLTEGGITSYVQEHHDIVIALAQRGIVSSICSKNDLGDVQAILAQSGLWDYFVFPSIDWSAKGPRLAGLIEQVQLRPETVLFVDDNPSNRGEAAALVPGLQVADEHLVAGLLDDPRFKGKDDASLSRLAQYKVLEKRSAEKVSHATDVHGFLRNSNIRVEIDYDVDPYLDRIVELINRTNQLNFTKKRLPDDPARAKTDLLAEITRHFTCRAGVVKVVDNFGDYGVVGFWLIDGVGYGHPQLRHFVFSCRTLGLGVEQWVYEKLDRPYLNVVGDVVSTLDFVPDWINRNGSGVEETKARALASTDVILRGGCELEVLRHFFSFDARSVTSEFVEYRRTQTIWLSHIATLFNADVLSNPDAVAAMGRAGYRPADFRSKLDTIGDDPTLVLISNSADLFAPLYRHKQHGFLLPAFCFGLELYHRETQEGIAAFVASHGFEDMASEAYDAVAVIQNEFVPEDLDVGLMRDLYRRLLDRFRANTFAVFLLPIESEIAPGGGRQVIPRQTEYNDAVRALVAGRANMAALDTADFITSPDQMLENTRFHFTRDVYFAIYRRVSALYADWQATAAIKPMASALAPAA